MRRIALALLALALLRADMYPDMRNAANPVISGIKSQIPGAILADESSWPVSANGYNANMDGPGNGFVLNIQGGANMVGPAPPYQRTGLLIQTFTRDPSLTGYHDMVGIDSRGVIKDGNPMGRAWGSYFRGEVEAGSDGYSTGTEIEMFNSATTDQPNVDTTTSKVGIHIIPRGTQHVTAGIYMNGGGEATRLHCGLCIKSAAIGDAAGDRAIWFGTPGGTENFGVLKDGTINISAAAKYQLGGNNALAYDGSVLYLGSTQVAVASQPRFFALIGSSLGTVKTTFRNELGGGFTRVTSNDAGVRPIPDADGGMVLGWNYSNGGGESNLWNVFSGGLGFNFKQVTAAGSHNELWWVDNKAHVRAVGAAPALTACGTSPAVAGSDQAGTVTMGTGSPAGCTITFAQAYAAAPICTVTWRATPLASQSYTTSTAALTLTQTATSSNLVDYHCTARAGG